MRSNPNAQTTLIAYIDYQDSQSQVLYGSIKDLAEKYGDKLHIQFKHYPITAIHPLAFDAAVAAECARDQNAFFEYSEALFASEKALDANTLFDIAQDLDLYSNTFESCFEGKRSEIEHGIAEAKANNILGSPSVVLNGQILPPLKASDLEDQIKLAIDGA